MSKKIIPLNEKDKHDEEVKNVYSCYKNWSDNVFFVPLPCFLIGYSENKNIDYKAYCLEVIETENKELFLKNLVDDKENFYAVYIPSLVSENIDLQKMNDLGYSVNKKIIRYAKLLKEI